MKIATIALALGLMGCAAETQESPIQGDNVSTVTQDKPQPGPEYDDGLPGIDPCSPQEVVVTGVDGVQHVVGVATLCDPREDNGVRPPDFIELPQLEQVAR